MRYSGSKARFMKELAPILTKHLDGENVFYDSFMGGGNVISSIDYEYKVGNELNSYVYGLWKVIQRKVLLGGKLEELLPESLTREEYDDVRNDYVNCTGKYPKWYIGYVGTCCSFGGAWFNGYAAYNPNKNEDHIKEAMNGLIRQAERFKHLNMTIFYNMSYDQLAYKEGSVIYCDPPYFMTKSYESDFDHARFWEWVRYMHKKGYHVYVSEYTAPSDFKCIWSREKKDGMGSAMTGISKTKVERLFVYDDAEI